MQRNAPGYSPLFRGPISKTAQALRADCVEALHIAETRSVEERAVAEFFSHCQNSMVAIGGRPPVAPPDWLGKQRPITGRVIGAATRVNSVNLLMLRESINRVKGWCDLSLFDAAHGELQRTIVHQAVQLAGAAESADTAEPALNGNGAAAAIESLLPADGAKILAIARSRKTVDNKMRAICRIDPATYLFWDSAQWAGLLDVKAAAIRQTHFWKVERKPAQEAFRARGD